jgi:hypothetical protein
MEFQNRNWYEFIWICGDQVVEQNLHNIGVIDWVMDAHPVSAIASGGVAWRPRTAAYGNLYDHNVCGFEHPNGMRRISHGRQYPVSTRVREAAYAGMKITWDMIMKSQQDLFPKVLDMQARIGVPPVPGVYKFV